MKPLTEKPKSHSKRSVMSPIARWLLLTAALTALTTSQAQVPIITNVWNVATDAHFDLPSGNVNNVRGIAINPLTTNVIYTSTFSSNHCAVISAANGSNYLGVLTPLDSVGLTNVITGGTLALPQVRVADDGAIYACNLSGAPASNFKIYKWNSDSDYATGPTVVYNSGVATSFQWRLGDYMDVRGSGIDTEIVVTGNGSGVNVTTNFVIFKPTDASATVFTNYSITIPGGAVNRCGGGVTFDGTNNAIYVKAAGANPVYRVTYNPATLTATIASTFNMDQTANNGLAYYETNGVKLIATVCTATTALTNATVHRAKILQLTTASNAVVVLSQALLQPYQANGNSLGLVDFQNGFAVFSEPNNAISLFQITGFNTNNPPSLGGAPSGGGVYVEGYSPVTLAISASGSAPLAYQWYFNTNTPIAGATSNSLALGAADISDSGTYNVIVTNLYGSITSSLASVTVLPGGYSTVATQIWTVAPGSRDYVTTTDTQRGLAYDPISESVVLVSRTPTNGIHVLSAATGADLGELDTSLLTAGTPPGTLPINMVAVADDGAVYVANLITSGASDTFAIYRWQDTTNGTAMGLSYFANPGIGRLGDTFAARGAGVNTELLASFRTGTNIAIFTTGDGSSFNFNLIAVTNLPPDSVANGFAGLGLAFGSSNTFWAKSSGFQLRQVRYDIAAGTGEVIYTSPNPPGSVGPIGVDAANGILAGVGFGQIPQNLSLYDLQTGGTAALIDRETFPANNPNANGTGAVAFDVAGGRLFALDSNSGLVAVNYAPRLSITPEVNGGIVTWTGPGTLQASAIVTGTYTNVTGATSPYTNTAASSLFFRVAR